MTTPSSPPFVLVRKKDYGNVAAGEYIDWFRPFVEQMHRIRKDTGSG
jgi:site-specific DNA-methyltransferase (cytosine-N4-specific)